MTVFRQDIVKYVTDRPGQVVYRTDIMEAGGFTASQVTTVMLRIQNSSPLGAEIQTVVRGNAWRYVPRQPVADASSNGRVVAPNLSLPLTTLIREYFVSHPNTVVWVTELARYTDKTERQVQVGVNNMINSTPHHDIKPYVKKVIQGQAWRFDPPPDWRPGQVRPSSAVVATTVTRSTRPTSTVDQSTVKPSTVAVTDSDDRDRDGDVRLFEEVGTAGDAIIIRDDDGVLYRATRLD